MLRCWHCGQGIDGATEEGARLRCPHCGRSSLDQELLAPARDLSLTLAEELAAEPYFRSARLSGYTLRTPRQGFLDDLRHPLARRLLRYLYALWSSCDDESASDLLDHALRQWIRPRHPLLANALQRLRRRHGRKLAALAPQPISFEAFCSILESAPPHSR